MSTVTTPVRARRPGVGRSLDLLVAVAGGMALGLFCAVSDRPNAPSSTVAQMVTPWVLLAATAGAALGNQRQCARAVVRRARSRLR